MKNLFKFGFLALALSLSVVACNSEKTGEGTDTFSYDSSSSANQTGGISLDLGRIINFENWIAPPSANITITLPQSSLSTGKIVYVSSSIGDAFTVVCPSGNTFGGYAIATPVTGGAATFVADGNGKWHIVSYIY